MTEAPYIIAGLVALAVVVALLVWFARRQRTPRLDMPVRPIRRGLTLDPFDGGDEPPRAA